MAKEPKKLPNNHRSGFKSFPVKPIGTQSPKVGVTGKKSKG